MKKVVIVVDAQVDFIKEQANLPVPGAEPLVEPINDYLKSLTKDDTHLVLYTFDTHTDDVYPDSPEGEMFPPHCYKGTPGWELAVTEDVQVPVYKLEKGVFNMWEEDNVKIKDAEGYECSREFFFAHLKRDELFDVEVVGFALNVCVKQAVEGLLDNGFRVKLLEELTKGIDTGGGEEDLDPRLVFKDSLVKRRLSIG